MKYLTNSYNLLWVKMKTFFYHFKLFGYIKYNVTVILIMGPVSGNPKAGKSLLSTFPVRKVLRSMPFRLKGLAASMRSSFLLVRVFCFPNKIKRKMMKRNIWLEHLYCSLFPSVMESYTTCGEHGLVLQKH